MKDCVSAPNVELSGRSGKGFKKRLGIYFGRLNLTGILGDQWAEVRDSIKNVIRRLEAIDDSDSRLA
jgi:hypothetical protein